MIKLLSRNRLLLRGWAAVHTPTRLLGSSKVKNMVTSSHRTVMVVVGGLNTLGKDEVPLGYLPGLKKHSRFVFLSEERELAYNRMLLSIRVTPRSGLTQILPLVGILAPDYFRAVAV
jgi:hypothetical protein